jgi:hypothetical protein
MWIYACKVEYMRTKRMFKGKKARGGYGIEVYGKFCRKSKDLHENRETCKEKEGLNWKIEQL